MVYDVLIERDAHDARTRLPGNVRQRIARLIDDLADNPRPNSSKPLDASDLDIPEGIALLRVRLEKWRVIYAVNDEDRWVWILAIRRRPPYSYEDLSDLAARLDE
jgi:mRNA interferase RelE/StbE